MFIYSIGGDSNGIQVRYTVNNFPGLVDTYYLFFIVVYLYNGEFNKNRLKFNVKSLETITFKFINIVIRKI